MKSGTRFAHAYLRGVNERPDQDRPAASAFLSSRTQLSIISRASTLPPRPTPGIRAKFEDKLGDFRGCLSLRESFNLHS